MVTLRDFAKADIPALQNYLLPGKTERELMKQLGAWRQKEYRGRYYEALAVVGGGETVGMVSLYQHTDFAVSCGIEIFPPFRRRGFAFEAMTQALQRAERGGYRLALDQVRTDNDASIALHQKLGFQADCGEYWNKNGNSVFLFLKLLCPPQA